MSTYNLSKLHYKQYKDSGVEWIGEIPEHWHIKKLKYLANTISSNVDKHFKLDEPKVYLCNYTDIYYNEVINSDTQLSEGSCTINEFEKNQLKVNDVVITKDSEDPNDIGVPSLIAENLDNTVCGYHLTTLRPSGLLGRFLFRYIQSDRARSYFALNARGITRFSIGKPSIQNLIVPIPPHNEQTAIANYLDEKTGQIDRLIDISQKKIERLQEYRTALINQVVTKGLDPNVPMKDSGIEWIGEIPEHWSLKRLKYEAKSVASNVDKHINEDEIGVKLCNYTDVYYNEFISSSLGLSDGTCTEKELKKNQLKSGDVVITKDSETSDDIGIPCLINDELNNVICGYHLTKIRSQKISSEFIFRYLQTNKVRSYFEMKATGVTRCSLSKDAIQNMPLLIPPYQEQVRICRFLNHKNSNIETNILKEQERIEKLQEYRQTFISEVVTGKKKVVNTEAYESA